MKASFIFAVAVLALYCQRASARALPAVIVADTDAMFLPVHDSVTLWSTMDDGPNCTLSHSRNLNFGGIFTSPASGTVIVTPASVASYTGGTYPHPGVTDYTVSSALVLLTIYHDSHRVDDDHESSDNDECDREEDDDGHHHDDRHNFTRHGASVTVSVSNSSTLTRIGGTETMTADTFTLSRDNGSLYIGGTLHVKGNQKSGNYSGTITVTTVCQ